VVPAVANRYSAETELVLLLASTAERRRLRHQRICDLAAAVNDEALGAEVSRQGIGLVIVRRMVELGIATDRLTTSFREARKDNGPKALAVEGRTLQAVRALEAAGIQAMPLKGPGLAQVAHGALEMRSSVDIDILVSPGDVEDSLGVLKQLGYSRHPAALRSKVHVALSHPDPERPPIELHSRLHWYGDAFSSRILREGKKDEEGIRKPSPPAGFAALLLFYAKDGFAGLRLPADIAAYADALKSDTWAEELDELVAFDPDVSPALRVASVVAQRIVGTRPVPSALPLSGREDLASRLANWRLSGDPDQMRAVIRLVDALLTPPARRRYFVSSRFAPFATRRRNAAYLAKTLVRWVPAWASVRGGRFAHPWPIGA
jgi:hypothetical protein